VRLQLSVKNKTLDKLSYMRRKSSKLWDRL